MAAFVLSFTGEKKTGIVHPAFFSPKDFLYVAEIILCK